MAPQAVLLAAGRANRILPLTQNRPKGMLLAGGKPLLQYAVEALAELGVDELVVVTGRKGEIIQSFFGDGTDFGVRVTYAHQTEPSGTLDALKAAGPHLDGPAWIVPGHMFLTPATLRPLTRARHPTVLVDAARADHVQMVPKVAGTRLEAFEQTAPTIGATRVSTGIMHADEAFLEHAATAQDPTIEAALARFAGAQRVDVAQPQGPWETVVDPWDLLRLNEQVLADLPKKPLSKVAHAEGAVHVGRNTTISPTASLIGPVTIGQGCTVGDRSVIGPYVSIRNNTLVGSHCEIRRSILNNNVYLDSRAVLRGCILDDGVQVGPGFLCAEDDTPQGPVGCILGEDSVVGAGARAQGGAILQPEGRIGDGEAL